MSTTTVPRTAPPPAAPTPRKRGAVVLVAAAVAVGAILAVLLVAGGVDRDQAARVSLVVVVQLVTGALLWQLARGPVTTRVSEVVGMGLAVGALTSLLGTQLLLPVGLGGWGWLLPSALVAACLPFPAVRRRLRSGDVRRPTVDELGGILGGIAVGLVFVWSFWRLHPLEWSGWWQYYVDIPHHEALATSLATWGPGDSILLVGEPIRYHWFAHGWAGAVTNASSAEPFVLVTRALPLVALIGTVCLVWAWAHRLSDSRVAPLLAVLVTMVAADVGTERNLNFVQLLTLSPSLALGALWFLGAALVFTEYLHRRIAWGPALLALMAVGCMGGKTSFAAVLGGGVALAALVSLWRSDLRVRAWIAFGVVLVALAGSFAALILGSTGNLRLEAGASATTFGVLPDRTWPGIVVGTLAVVLMVAAKWAGAAGLLVQRRTALRPELWFGLGVAGTGLVLTSALGHPGASQLYFPISAGLVVGVVSAWGLAESLGRVPREWITAAVLVGLAAGMFAWPGIPGVSRLLAPYLAWLLPACLALGALVWGVVGRLARRGSTPRAGALVTVACVLGWGLLGASVVAGQAAIEESVRVTAPAEVAANTPTAFTESHEAALRWLRDNSAQDDVVVTNRQCSGPQVGAVPCAQARWFLTAALGHRRMYVEGVDYAAAVPTPDWVVERVERSRRFVDAPTTADAQVLWDAGVRWIVVDLASTTTRGWTPFAEEAFATDTTVILRLSQP